MAFLSGSVQEDAAFLSGQPASNITQVSKYNVYVNVYVIKKSEN